MAERVVLAVRVDSTNVTTHLCFGITARLLNFQIEASEWAFNRRHILALLPKAHSRFGWLVTLKASFNTFVVCAEDKLELQGCASSKTTIEHRAETAGRLHCQSPVRDLPAVDKWPLLARSGCGWRGGRQTA